MQKNCMESRFLPFQRHKRGAVANHSMISDSPIDFKNYAHKERSLLKIDRDGHTKPEVDEKSASFVVYSVCF